MLYKIPDHDVFSDNTILEISNRIDSLNTENLIKIKFNDEIDSSKNGYYLKFVDKDGNATFMKDTGNIIFSRIIQFLKEGIITEIDIEEKIIAIKSDEKIDYIIEILSKHKNELILKDDIEDNKKFIMFNQADVEKCLSKEEINILESNIKRCSCCGIYSNTFLPKNEKLKDECCMVCNNVEGYLNSFLQNTKNKYECSKLITDYVKLDYAAKKFKERLKLEGKI